VKHAEKIAPVAAVLGAMTAIACCLPVTFVAFAATASIAAVVSDLQPWLLGVSVLLLALGFVQVSRPARACSRRSVGSLAILWLSVAIVATVLLFPQLLAGMIADWLS
jgi:hypothetical protein